MKAIWLTIVWGVGLSAQSTLAAVGDRQTFQAIRSASCTTATECSADFNPVPDGVRLEITHTSCLLRISAGEAQTVKFHVVNAGGSIVMTDFGAPSHKASDPTSSGAFYVLNSQTLLYVKP